MTSILGINRTSDASICLLDEGKVSFAIAKERITKQKHDWGKIGDLANVYGKAIPSLSKTKLDLVVECYSSDEEFLQHIRYLKEIESTLIFKDKPQIIQLSHHLAHVYSAFFPSPFTEAAVIVLDFQGSYASMITEKYEKIGFVNDNWLEVASYYNCSDSEVACVKKQFWNQKPDQLTGLGTFYARLTQCMFTGIGHEGTVMGLAPYGNTSTLKLPPLHVEDGMVTIPMEWINVFESKNNFNFFRNGSGSFQACADLAASGQRAFEQALLHCVEWLAKKTGQENLILVGGCALNCAANGKVLKESSFKKVFVPPAPHDGGTALGCAIYGNVQMCKQPNNFKWTNDYLGPLHDIHAFIDDLSNRDDLAVEKPVDLAATIAEAIANGDVIAVFQNGSEFGPRALGNRSIIADARYSFMTHYINDKIKSRQWFRPLSPMVLSEDKDKYFEMNDSSPFMLFAFNATDDCIRQLRAISHVDNSARVQTIDKFNNPFIYDLLLKYKERTTLSVLLNTSFNGPGEPIVENPQDALDCFLSTPINKLVMPPFVLSKKMATTAFGC